MRRARLLPWPGRAGSTTDLARCAGFAVIAAVAALVFEPARAGGPVDPAMVEAISAEEVAALIGRGRWIEGRRISAADLIRAIRSARAGYRVRIRGSVIVGPLELGRLPRRPFAGATGRQGSADRAPVSCGPGRRSSAEPAARPSAGSLEMVDSTILSAAATGLGRASLEEALAGASEADSIALDASDVVFDSGLVLENVMVAGKARFDGAHFAGPSSFERSEFLKDATFQRGVFHREVSFDNVVLHGETFFSTQEFVSRASFRDVRFARIAVFRGTQFAAAVNFTGANFRHELNARGAAFAGGATFLGARFAGPVEFQEACFARRASFQGAAFEQPAYFTDTEFAEIYLQGVTLGIYGDFRGTRIAALNFDSAFRPAFVEGRLDFQRANIAWMCLQDVTFRGPVSFADARLGHGATINADRPARFCRRADADRDGATPLPEIDLRAVTFDGDVTFLRTAFTGPVSFEQAHFNGLVDFTGASFPQAAETGVRVFALSYTDFRDFRLRWNQLPAPRHWRSGGDLQPQSEVLSVLEAKFRERRQLADANEAYYHFKRAELEELRAKAEHAAWGDDVHRDWLLAEAVSVFWGKLSGYGTRFWRVLGWALLIDLAFTLIYAGFARIDRKDPPQSAHEFQFRQRLFDLPKDFVGGATAAFPGAGAAWLRKFINALRFSSVVLFKIGPRDTTVSGRIGPLGLQYVVAVEWLIGYYLLAALVYTLAETMPLINRLMTGIF